MKPMNSCAGSHRPGKRLSNATLAAEPVLRFSPAAWAKLRLLRDHGQTEVGGFGIAAGSDLLLVQDVQLVRQCCTPAGIRWDDISVAHFIDRQVARGLRPEQAARIWVHTHPAGDPRPSEADEDLFRHFFGSADWAVMFVLARGDRTYARLQFNVGPGGRIRIPVEVDFTQPFAGSNPQAWEHQYRANVRQECPFEVLQYLAAAAGPQTSFLGVSP